MMKQKYKAPAVKKVLEILEIMAQHNRRFTVTELAVELNISVNSVFRITKELEYKNYLIKNHSDSSYELTPKLYYLGNLIKNRISFVKTAQPFMEQISRATNETVLLTTLDNNFATLVVDQIGSPLPLKFLSSVGVSYDSYSSAMGKAMLSTLSDDELSEYLKNTKFIATTSNTLTDKLELYNCIKSVAETGIAYDYEESITGLICIACPVFSSGKKLEGALGVSGIKYRMSEENMREFSRLIKEVTENFSFTLGYEN